MDRHRIFRAARFVVSVAFGILCLLLVALWVRSFWWVNSVSSMTRELNIDSCRGELIVSRNIAAPSSGDWGMVDKPVNVNDQSYRMTTLGFFYRRVGYQFWLVIPYWFPVLIPAVLAATIWLPLKFSLRTMLFGMTLVAVTLGMAGVCYRNL